MKIHLYLEWDSWNLCNKLWRNEVWKIWHSQKSHWRQEGQSETTSNQPNDFLYIDYRAGTGRDTKGIKIDYRYNA